MINSLKNIFFVVVLLGSIESFNTSPAFAFSGQQKSDVFIPDSLSRNDNQVFLLEVKLMPSQAKNDSVSKPSFFCTHKYKLFAGGVALCAAIGLGTLYHEKSITSFFKCEKLVTKDPIETVCKLINTVYEMNVEDEKISDLLKIVQDGINGQSLVNISNLAPKCYGKEHTCMGIPGLKAQFCSPACFIYNSLYGLWFNATNRELDCEFDYEGGVPPASKPLLIRNDHADNLFYQKWFLNLLVLLHELKNLDSLKLKLDQGQSLSMDFQQQVEIVLKAMIALSFNLISTKESSFIQALQFNLSRALVFLLDNYCLRAHKTNLNLLRLQKILNMDDFCGHSIGDLVKKIS